MPIGVELDPHCHLSQKMVNNATALITFKEYPHIDAAERAEELFDIIASAAEGKSRPAISVFDCRMIGIYHTTREPMRSYVDRIKGLEGRDGVLSISVVHGFPWGDVPDMGTKILVVTDGRPEYGERLAQELGRELFEMPRSTASQLSEHRRGVESSVGDRSFSSRDGRYCGQCRWRRTQ